MYDVADCGAWRGRNLVVAADGRGGMPCIFDVNAEEKLCKTAKKLAGMQL